MALDEDTVRLAKGKNLATVVTLMPDGQPQALPTWVDTDGEYLLVNTEPTRQRARNLACDPRITVPLPQARTPVTALAAGEHCSRQVADHVPETGHCVVGRDRLEGGQVQVGDDIPVRRTPGRSGNLRLGPRRHLHLAPDFSSDSRGFIRVICIDGQA